MGSRRRIQSIDAVPLLLMVLVASGCAQARGLGVSAMPFDTAQVILRSGTDSVSLLVEVASSYEQKALGLSRRPSLDPDSGMLFLYDSARPEGDGFWMWETRMPLDIAFIDSAFVIREILRMAPCADAPSADACPQYYTSVAYLAALEVNRGWFDENGIGVGSRVEVKHEAR